MLFWTQSGLACQYVGGLLGRTVPRKGLVAGWNYKTNFAVRVTSFAKSVEVGLQNNMGGYVVERREGTMVRNVIDHQPHGELSLNKGASVYGGANCALLEIWNHACKQIGRDERDLA